LIRSRILRAALAGGLAAGTVAAFAAPAGADLDAVKADNQIVRCTGGVLIAKLNPALSSSTPAYTKVAAKSSTGTVLVGGNPAPVDALTCSIDAGIRTNQAGQSVKYLLDNQTNGNATLNILSQSGTFSGSATCKTADFGGTGPAYEYPNEYPLQGKMVWKFTQLDEKSHNIQLQQYVRLGRAVGDTDPTHIAATGIVIKGPGVGGTSDGLFAFAPTDSTKNLNLLDCVGAPPSPANLAELQITQADGTDAGTTPDPWDVSIPA
jgi:hypothetical protein